MQVEGKMQTVDTYFLSIYRCCYFHYRFLIAERVIQANRGESLQCSVILSITLVSLNHVRVYLFTGKTIRRLI